MHSVKSSLAMVWILAVSAMLLSGIAYRVVAQRLRVVVTTPIDLPVPLENIPKDMDDWVGEDVPMSDAVKRIAGNDDYINRIYRSKSGKKWANVYVAYSARPRTMLGHRPDVCYVGAGWIHDSTDASDFVSSRGRTVPCLIHRFHSPGPASNQIVVLNFYVLNGRATADESGFSGVDFRTPGIDGDPARYVAQIQISSVLEDSVRSAAARLTDVVLDYLPDENGSIAVIEEPRIESLATGESG